MRQKLTTFLSITSAIISSDTFDKHKLDLVLIESKVNLIIDTFLEHEFEPDLDLDHSIMELIEAKPADPTPIERLDFNKIASDLTDQNNDERFKQEYLDQLIDTALSAVGKSLSDLTSLQSSKLAKFLDLAREEKYDSIYEGLSLEVPGYSFNGIDILKDIKKFGPNNYYNLMGILAQHANITHLIVTFPYNGEGLIPSICLGVINYFSHLANKVDQPQLTLKIPANFHKPDLLFENISKKEYAISLEIQYGLTYSNQNSESASLIMKALSLSANKGLELSSFKAYNMASPDLTILMRTIKNKPSFLQKTLSILGNSINTLQQDDLIQLCKQHGISTSLPDRDYSRFSGLSDDMICKDLGLSKKQLTAKLDSWSCNLPLISPDWKLLKNKFLVPFYLAQAERDWDMDSKSITLPDAIPSVPQDQSILFDVNRGRCYMLYPHAMNSGLQWSGANDISRFLSAYSVKNTSNLRLKSEGFDACHALILLDLNPQQLRVWLLHVSDHAFFHGAATPSFGGFFDFSNSLASGTKPAYIDLNNNFYPEGITPGVNEESILHARVYGKHSRSYQQKLEDRLGVTLESFQYIKIPPCDRGYFSIEYSPCAGQVIVKSKLDKFEQTYQIPKLDIALQVDSNAANSESAAP